MFYLEIFLATVSPLCLVLVWYLGGKRSTIGLHLHLSKQIFVEKAHENTIVTTHPLILLYTCA